MLFYLLFLLFEHDNHGAIEKKFTGFTDAVNSRNDLV